MLLYVCHAFETDLAYHSCSSSRLPKLHLNNQNEAAHGFDVLETDDTSRPVSRKKSFPPLGSVIMNTM